MPRATSRPDNPDELPASELMLPLEAGSGLELVERAAADADTGRPVTLGNDVLLGVVRGGRLRRFGDADADVMRPGDRIVVVRHIGTEPPAQ